jgi:hypothetical protein
LTKEAEIAIPQAGWRSHHPLLMNLLTDIRSRRLLILKGALFLLLGLMASALLLYEILSLRTVMLMMVAVWAFCRFYYFLFYVLENYAGRKQKYAGIFDLVACIFRGRR